MGFGRILVAVALAGGAVGVAARWITARRSSANRRADRQSELVDEVGRESFPASDPPSWTLGSERRD